MAILVSNQMYEALDDAEVNPAATSRDSLDLLIERRFTGLRAATIERVERTGLPR